MAFFIPFTVECDNCKETKTLKASSKRDMNRRLINPQKITDTWFAEENTHFCDKCHDEWPYLQDPCGDKLE